MLSWVARGVLVAAVVAAAELLLLVPVFPAAASSLAGLLRAYLSIARIELLVAIPLGLVCWGMYAGLCQGERRGLWRLRLPEAAWAVAVLLVLPSAALGFASLSGSILRKELDFEETRHALLVVAATLSLAGALAVERWVATPLLRKALGRALLTHHSRVLALVIATWALVSLYIGHAVLAPANQVTRSAIVGVIAVGLGLIASAVSLPTIPSHWQRIAAGVAALLLVSTPFDRHPAGRFVLYGPASTAGPIASFLRSALDRDGDGASPIWVGGSDCAEADASRGPHVLELPADGIDQDCRGGDAAARAVPTSTLDSQLAALGCSAPSEPRAVLLFIIDAWRADTVRPEVAPNLHRFAAGALRFTRAYSPSTMTGPSLAGIFAGHSISEINPRNVAASGQLAVAVSLADRFRNAGYGTAAFNRVALTSTSFGGFDESNPNIVDVQPRRKGQLLAAGMVSGALSYLRRSARPTFVWVHFLDTHAPYPFADGGNLSPAQEPLTPYERGVQYVDAHVGRLLREVVATGLAEKAVIAITADHGESLGARARQGHGPYLFDDVTHVPLLIGAPGCAARSIDEPVSLTHLGATLGALAGVAMPGRGLLSAANEARLLPVVVEETPLSMVGFKRAIISGHHKLIIDVSNGGRMLFNLAADPGETHDILASAPDVARALDEAYQRWLDSAGSR